MYIYVCMYIYIYIYMYICLSGREWMYRRAFSDCGGGKGGNPIYTYICVCVYVNVCICVCMYILDPRLEREGTDVAARFLGL